MWRPFPCTRGILSCLLSLLSLRVLISRWWATIVMTIKTHHLEPSQSLADRDAASFVCFNLIFLFHSYFTKYNGDEQSIHLYSCLVLFTLNKCIFITFTVIKKCFLLFFSSIGDSRSENLRKLQPPKWLAHSGVRRAVSFRDSGHEWKNIKGVHPEKGLLSRKPPLSSLYRSIHPISAMNSV